MRIRYTPGETRFKSANALPAGVNTLRYERVNTIEELEVRYCQRLRRPSPHVRRQNPRMARNAVHHGNTQHDLQVLLLPVPRELSDGLGEVLRIAQELARRHRAILRDACGDDDRSVCRGIQNERNDGVVVRNIPVRPGPSYRPLPLLRMLAIHYHVDLARRVLAEGEAQLAGGAQSPRVIEGADQHGGGTPHGRQASRPVRAEPGGGW